MKKIILILMMMSSFAFSYSYYEKYPSNYSFIEPPTEDFYFYSPEANMNVDVRSNIIVYRQYVEVGSAEFSKGYNFFEGNSFTSYFDCVSTPSGNYACLRTILTASVSNPCENGYTVNSATGECVAPTDPLECNPVHGTFTNLDGQCTDCSSHSTDKDYSDMANCACGATGSIYIPSSITPEVPVIDGNTTYVQSQISCADGSKKMVYFNKATPSDNNSTTPPTDNNSTSPTDNNNTKPNDNNGTIPNDGNGTKPNDGKDYTRILNDMFDRLNSISGYTKSTSDGINGDYPATANMHNIPTDTSGGDWNTYQQTWGNIVDSVNGVSDKVGQFTSLVNGGFDAPFAKASVSSCPYVTSFQFGSVGSIPIDVDLCKTFSPVRPVIYTFAYIFFVFAILSFCVKMFLRLV